MIGGSSSDDNATVQKANDPLIESLYLKLHLAVSETNVHLHALNYAFRLPLSNAAAVVQILRTRTRANRANHSIFHLCHAILCFRIRSKRLQQTQRECEEDCERFCVEDVAHDGGAERPCSPFREEPGVCGLTRKEFSYTCWSLRIWHVLPKWHYSRQAAYEQEQQQQVDRSDSVLPDPDPDPHQRARVRPSADVGPGSTEESSSSDEVLRSLELPPWPLPFDAEFGSRGTYWRWILDEVSDDESDSDDD